MTHEEEILELTVGSVAQFDILLFDDQDQPENLTNVPAARFTIRDGPTDSTPILDLSTGGHGLTIDVANSKLVAFPTQGQMNALEVGQYVGQVALYYIIPDIWRKTEPFKVRIVTGAIVENAEIP